MTKNDRIVASISAPLSTSQKPLHLQQVVEPEAQFISSTSSSLLDTTQTFTTRGLLGLTCAELSCCDFVLVRADVFRSSDGFDAQGIITAAPKLLDSDSDTIRFGYENVTVWKEPGNAHHIIEVFDVGCWWSHC
jgi:hypothetical protein